VRACDLPALSASIPCKAAAVPCVAAPLTWGLHVDYVKALPIFVFSFTCQYVPHALHSCRWLSPGLGFPPSVFPGKVHGWRACPHALTLTLALALTLALTRPARLPHPWAHHRLPQGTSTY